MSSKPTLPDAVRLRFPDHRKSKLYDVLSLNVPFSAQGSERSPSQSKEREMIYTSILDCLLVLGAANCETPVYFLAPSLQTVNLSNASSIAGLIAAGQVSVS